VQALPAGRQGGYGVVFAIQVQILLSITSVAPACRQAGYKVDRSRDPDSFRDIPGYKVCGGHWRSVAP